MKRAHYSIPQKNRFRKYIHQLDQAPRCLLIVLMVFVSLPVIWAQAGKVGVNTLLPKALLHVADSSVLFTGAFPLPNSPGAPPLSGEGTRMMWYADKAAFRVGRVQGNEWDKDSIGINSFASGFNAKATKNYSTAMGQGTSAVGDNSTALGRFAMASGSSSVSIGEETTASGFASIAMGYANGSVGYSSLTLGNSNTAYGDYAIGLGYLNFAGGNFSLAFGEENGANGTGSFVGGQYTACDADYGIAIGQGLYTTSYLSTYFGRYNHTSIAYSPNEWVETDPIFAIGNGDGGSYTNALTVLKNGNVGIGPTDPTDKFEVDGSFRLGEQGSSLQSVIKGSVDLDISSISSGGSNTSFINVPNAATGSTVHLSPASALPDGILIAYARVSAAHTVEVKFSNINPSSVDPDANTFYVTVIQ